MESMMMKGGELMGYIAFALIFFPSIIIGRALIEKW